MIETDRFLKDVRLLSRHRTASLEIKLEDYIYPQLKREPHYGPNIKRLRAWEPPTGRYRVGNWRFFYIISEATKTVFMIAAAHRKEAYR